MEGDMNCPKCEQVGYLIKMQDRENYRECRRCTYRENLAYELIPPYEDLVKKYHILQRIKELVNE